MATIELSKAVMHRVEKISEKVGRTPEETMRFVMRDGLDATEEYLDDVLAGTKELEAGNGVAWEKVKAEGLSMLNNANGKKAA